MSTNTQQVGSLEHSKARAGAVPLLRRGLALALAYLMIPMSIGDVYAQQYGQNYPPPPPNQQYGQPNNQQYGQQYGQPYNPQYGQQYPQQYGQQYGQPYGQPSYYQPLSPDQLDQLVAPVALYPDALLAQVLAASTYPTQVMDADRWMQSYQGYPPDQVAQMANGMPWDPSVKSLTAFPSVLNDLASNLNWTSQLGNAYYNQPQDVMEAVQAMRQQAYDSGYLRSTPQMYVNYSPAYISIMPANPSVVYVPYYNPWNVYGPVIHPWYSYYAPPPAGVYFGGLAIGFGVGIAIVSFTHWGWGWGHWRPDWRRHEIYYGHRRYISRSRSVFNYGHFGGFDRHWARADFRRGPNGHAQGFDRNHQFHGRPNFQNPNFHAAPGRQQNFNRGRQNFNPRPAQNFNSHRQQNAFGNRQSFNQRQPQQFRNQQNFNRGQQNFNPRPAQNFNQRQQNAFGNRQSFNQRQPQQFRNQQNFNRGQQNFNRPPQNFNRPQQRFNPRPQNQFQNRQNFNRPQPQFRNQQNFNRGRQNFNRPQQRFNSQPQNQSRQNFSRPQNHGRPQGHPNNHGNGHGRR